MYLELDRLSKQFDGKYAVHDLSLGLEEGGLLCILGSSGCGKTTTLNMIGGFSSLTAAGCSSTGRTSPRSRLSGGRFRPFSSPTACFRT